MVNVEDLARESKITDILEISDDKALIIDSRERIVYSNENFKNWIGAINDEDIIGRHLYEFICEEDRKRASKHLKRIFKRGGGFQKTFDMVDLIGTSHPCRVTSTQLKGTGTTGAIVHIVDEEERRVEEALREHSRRYQMLMDNAFDAIYILKEENYEYVNRRFCEITGYDFRYLTSGDFDFNVLLTDRAKEVIEERYERRKSGEDVENPYQIDIINRSGEIRTVEVSTVSLGLEEGVTVMGIMRDITSRKGAERKLERYRENLESLVEERTRKLNDSLDKLQVEAGERKRADRKLAQEKERLSITIESLSEAVITTDTHSRITMMNRSATEMLGLSNEEAFGKKTANVLYFQRKRERQRASDPIKRAINERNSYYSKSDRVLKLKNGTELDVEYTSAPVEDIYGDLIGAVLVIPDVTERKKIQLEELRASRLESLGLLAGGVAHDFKNIIMSVMGNVSIAKLKTDDDSILNSLSKAEEALKEANAMTRQLLSFSKGESPVKKVVSLKDLIRESVSFISSGSGVEIKYDLPDDLWETEVDQTQMNQVLNNLVINAIQATGDQGVVEISASNKVLGEDEKVPEGKYVEIRISDDGRGIPEENLERIFDPYFTTKETGTGFGLSTSYRIIRSHQGMIHVDSQEGEGSTFTIHLLARE